MKLILLAAFFFTCSLAAQNLLLTENLVAIRYLLEQRYFLNSTETGNANDSYWLLWGVGNSGKDYNAFGIYPEGKFQYGKLANGQWDAKAGSVSSSSINVGANKANVLRVEKRKDEVFFFINGIEVHKANFEKFNINYTGIGFQVNCKKVADIDYLKIFRDTVPNITVSPEPYESNFQKALNSAGNSLARANAIIDYYVALKQLSYSAEQLENLLGQKFLQMMDIDYHGFYLVLMSKKINLNDVKLFMKASNVLTSEQKDAIKLIAQYNVDEFLATKNNTAKPAYPTGVPKPGYGWGKTVSSGKTTTVNNNNVKAPPVVPVKQPVDELALLKSGAVNLQGKRVYITGNKTIYSVPARINITSLNDEITLVGVGAHFQYSYSAGRNVFGTKSLSHVTNTIKVKELLRLIDLVSGYYIVTEIDKCGYCLGQGSAWHNESRTRTMCKYCGGTGCVPIAIWNNGSSRAY